MTPWDLILKWNWKAALLSAALRGAIFFTTNLSAGLEAAQRAVLVDALFRIPLAGFNAAVIQAVVRSTWGPSAAVTAIVIVPLVAHSVEFAVHHAAGTAALHVSIIVSAAFSVISSSFEWFAMRNGALLVGSGSATLGNDLLRLPRLILSFLAAAVALCSRSRTRARAR